MIDTTPPVMGSARMGTTSGDELSQQFTSSVDVLWVNWDEASDADTGIHGYQVAIGSASGSDDVMGYARVGMSTAAGFTSLKLEHLGEYYATLRAQNYVGLYSNTTAGPIRVDATPPSCSLGIGTLAAPAQPGQVLQDLSFHVTCQDEESGLTDLSVGVSRIRGVSEGPLAAQAVPQSQPPTTEAVSVDISGESLLGEPLSGWRYYLLVEASNGAGTTALFSTPDGISLDATPPVVLRQPRDGATVDMDVWRFVDYAIVNWAIIDNESGPTEFKVGLAMGMPPADPAQHSNLAGVVWAVALAPTNATQVLRMNLPSGSPLVHGQAYHSIVVGTNGANGVTTARTNGFVVDTRPATCSTPSVGPQLDTHLSIQSSRLPLMVTYACTSTTGISSYAVGLSERVDLIGGGTALREVMPVTDVGLKTFVVAASVTPRNGATYVFTVIATNGIGVPVTLESAATLVDYTPPVRNATGLTVSFPTSTDAVVSYPANLFIDGESGIQLTTIAMGQSAGSADLTNGVGVEVDEATSCTASLCTVTVSVQGGFLAQGSLVFITVEAVNNAGLSSQLAATGWVDRTAPDYDSARLPAFEATIVLPDDAGSQPNYAQGGPIDGVAVSVPLVAFDDHLSGLAYFDLTLEVAQAASPSAFFTVDSFRLTVDAVNDPRPTMATFSAVSLANGDVVRVVVTATNGNLLSASPVTSGSATLVLQQLVAGVVFDGPGTGVGVTGDLKAEDLEFFFQTTAVHAHWRGFSNGTSAEGLAFTACLGTSMGGCELVAARSPVVGQTGAGFALGSTAFLTLPEVADGTTVYTTVDATDGVTTVSATSDGVLLDGSRPEVTWVGIGATVDSHTRLVQPPYYVNWRASDPHSGLKACFLRLRAGSGGEVFDMYKDGVLLPLGDNGAASTQGRAAIELPVNASEGHAFSAELSCRNRAGLQQSLSSAVSIVETTPPVGGVVTLTYLDTPMAAPYTWRTNNLTASFAGFRDAESEITRYECSFEARPQNLSQAGELQTSPKPVLVDAPGGRAATSCTLEGVDGTLWDGWAYHVSVIAYNGAGMSTTSVSSAVIIDATPPTGGAVVTTGINGTGSILDNVTTITSPAALQVAWAGFEDLESGLVSGVWKVGTTQGGADIITGVPIAREDLAEGSILMTQLTLPDDVMLYSSITITNGANASVTVHAEGVPVVYSPPTAGRVVDGWDLAADVAVQNSTTVLVAWEPFTVFSGFIVEYEWAVCSIANQADCPLQFSPVGLATNYSNSGLPLQAGVTYRSFIRATDSSGWTATASSNGFTIDDTAPIQGLVFDGPGVGVDDEQQGTWETFAASWLGFADYESSIVEYRWAVGTAMGSDDVVAWRSAGLNLWASAPGYTLFDLPDHLYQLSFNTTSGSPRVFVTVEARNGVGATTLAFSNGVDIDVSPPEAVRLLLSGLHLCVFCCCRAHHLTLFVFVCACLCNTGTYYGWFGRE